MHPTFVDGSCWKISEFAFDTSKGLGTATQVMPLISHIVMSYVHQTSNFATECMFDGHGRTTDIA